MPRILMIPVLALLASLLLHSANVEAQALSEMSSISWMSLDRETRNNYVWGFFSGVQYILKVLDMDIRYAGEGSISTSTLSDAVYLKLLREPELRQGPIGAIIWEAVKGRVTITDRDGIPLQEKRPASKPGL